MKLNRSLEVSVKWDEVIRKSTIWFAHDLNVEELWKDCWVNQGEVVDFLKEQAKSYSKSNTSTKSSRSDFIYEVFPLNNASGSLASLLFLYRNILPLPSHSNNYLSLLTLLKALLCSESISWDLLFPSKTHISTHWILTK